MKRRLVVGVLIIVCFLLQCTVFQTLSLASISPNLLLIVTSSLGFLRGEREGMFIGFFSGFLTDIFFGRVFGFYALLYMFIGYGSGLFHMMFYDEDIKLPMFWVALSDLVYGLCVYFFLFLMRSKFDFGHYFTHIIMPELIYTVAVTILVYRMIWKFNAFLDRLEEEAPAGMASITTDLGQTENKTEEP